MFLIVLFNDNQGFGFVPILGFQAGKRYILVLKFSFYWFRYLCQGFTIYFSSDSLLALWSLRVSLTQQLCEAKMQIWLAE